MGLPRLVLNPVKIKNLNKTYTNLEKMAKPSSSQKTAISFSQKSEIETFSQPKFGSNVSNVVEEKKSEKLDFSSLPSLASKKDEVIVRLTALENKLEALVELLSK